MKWDAKSIIQKYERLYNAQGNWRSLWQDVADYIIPKRSNILQQNSPGTKQTTRLFDSTAIHANELLAASMKQAITPSNTQWFSLRIRDESLMDNPTVVKWLEECSRKMFLAFHQSNFDSEVHELDLDLGAFGMGAVFAEETIPFKGLRFHACAMGDYCIEEDAEGMVDSLIRKTRITARAAFKKWGKNVGEKIGKMLEKDPEKLVSFLHMVVPMDGRPGIYQGYYVNLDHKEMPEKPKIFLEMPYLVPRWGKTAGEDYGRGPGFIAMPDIKTLNKAVQLELKALGKMIDPPMKQSDGGVIGVPKIQPGGMTTVRPNAIFEAMQFNIDLKPCQIKSEDLKKSIRTIFFSDQLQFQDTPQMTAAEAYIRYELMQRLLGPTLGRMEREFLNPLIRRCFGIMFRAGIFGEMPEELSGVEGAVDIEYEGAMAKAQKSQEMTGLTDVLQVLSITAQVDMSVFDWINFDEMIQWLWDVKGVPKKLLNDIDDVTKTRKARDVQGMAQKTSQEKMMYAEIIRKLTAALKAGALPPEILQAMLVPGAGANVQETGATGQPGI